jgi:ABC-type bacteriocin/lantibiotic exporter with double-glycine peptidase domain
VDSSVFDDAHGPELVNRFFDVLTVQKAGSTLLVDGSALALQTLVGMVVLAFYHPYLLAFDALLVLAMGFIFVGLGRRAAHTSIVESKKKYAVAAWLQETMRHSVLFKGTGGEEFARRRTYELTQAYLGARRDHFRILFRQIVGALGLQVVFSSVLIAMGGFLVLQKQLTLGQLVAAELIVAGVLAGFSKVGKQLESLYDILASFDKLGHLLDLPSEGGGSGAFPEGRRGPASLAIKGVSFRYGGREVLDNASLHVQAGERVALLGPNGSGKSTLMSLVYGLRAPESGLIEVDGETVHTLKVRSLRSHVGMVRGLEIFEGTILDNVVAGRSSVSRDDAREALQQVDLWDDVKTWKDGLDTRLNSYGSSLSLGQARKLVLARAVVTKPRLLILDESLDDLDARSREVVTRFLFDPHRPWTVIVTTHDASTLRLCTRAVALEDGQFREVVRHPVGAGGEPS